MIHNNAVLTLSEGWRKQSSALKICVGGNKEKALKIAVQAQMVRVFITKLLKILCFTAFKTYSDRALPTERGDLLVKIKRWKWFLCKARFVLDNKFGGYRCRSQAPSTRS